MNYEKINKIIMMILEQEYGVKIIPNVERKAGEYNVTTK